VIFRRSEYFCCHRLILQSAATCFYRSQLKHLFVL
jgi:hypothetical protein